jgi:uncharacterized membrane protein
MTALQVVLLLAAFLSCLVAGLLFTFAIVVMPGIHKLDDGNFLRAFQVIDGVIQNNQPAFLFVWAGSVLAVAGAAVLSIWELSGTDLLLVMTAALVYILGVQLPTVVVNLPLNNIVQKLDPGAMSELALEHARRGFEPRWNRWNTVRTACSIFSSVLLLVLLLRL